MQRSDYILGLLSKADQTVFEQHLKECEECQEELAFERRLIQATRETLAASTLSPQQLAACRPAIPVLPQKRPISKWFMPLRTLQPLMAAIVIFFVALSSFGALGGGVSAVAATSTLTSTLTATATFEPTVVATHAIAPSATPAPPTPIAAADLDK